MVRHDILFISQRCSLILIQHVCVSFSGLVFIMVIHQLKSEALQDLKDNRTFSTQSRATTRCNAATADSSNMVRTISHDILRGTLMCLQLLEPLSAHSHVVVHAENCKFPSSIAAPKNDLLFLSSNRRLQRVQFCSIPGPSLALARCLHVERVGPNVV